MEWIIRAITVGSWHPRGATGNLVSGLLLDLHGVHLRSAKIEYRQYSSGQIRSAMVEAPKEALSLDCRPCFGTTWVTKDKFRVGDESC
ncbi:hypothetical protein C5167_021455 [Papaver somniferum]|nr:hypothetical protein C5167_021455 [Papaver somniferum]